MSLRPYQLDVKNGIYDSWNAGNINVMPVLPTGGGKTRVFTNIMSEYDYPSIAIAHRNELVSQISLALAFQGVRHQIIASKNAIREIVRQHKLQVGGNFFDPDGKTYVAGVVTLIKRQRDLSHIFPQIGLWVQDEGHHILKNNQWGKAAALMPNAYGLAPTATPIRADGKGLGRHADGIIDDLVIGPSMRWLINNPEGYLTDYKIFAPPIDVDFDVEISKSTGDYNQHQLREWNHQKKKKIVGDVVEHYLRLAKGKQGVTFVVDVEMAKATAAKFRAAGVPAEAISAKTPEHIRNNLLNKFRSGKILQLVNVDLFGEGFDLPAIEVVSMARHTMSYSLFAQQFGRALRPLPGKTHAIIIDHVGNVHRHGLPDRERQWTLDGREKRRSLPKVEDVIPTTNCPQCTQVYEKIYHACPHCGYKPIPAERSLPEQVDGDLLELTPDMLAKLRGERDKADLDPDQMYNYMKDKRPELAHSVANGQQKRLEAQRQLRDAISWFAGYHRSQGADDKEIYRRFYFKFGTDIMSAQLLKKRDAEQLEMRVRYELRNLGIETQHNSGSI